MYDMYVYMHDDIIPNISMSAGPMTNFERSRARVFNSSAFSGLTDGIQNLSDQILRESFIQVQCTYHTNVLLNNTLVCIVQAIIHISGCFYN